MQQNYIMDQEKLEESSYNFLQQASSYSRKMPGSSTNNTKPPLCKLSEILVNTAQCERWFSVMGIAKSNRINHLSDDQLMAVSLHGQYFQMRIA